MSTHNAFAALQERDSAQDGASRYPRAHRYGTSGVTNDHVAQDLIPAYRSSQYQDRAHDGAYHSSYSGERAWRRDSPMDHNQDPEEWKDTTELRPRDSATSLRSSTASFALDEDKAHAWEVAHNWPFMPPRSSGAQRQWIVPDVGSSWASSGNAPSPRRAPNFSRPYRGEDDASARQRNGNSVAQRPVRDFRYQSSGDSEDELTNDLRDLRLEERLRRLDRPRTKPQPQSQPQAQQQTARVLKLPQSGKAYSRPRLSPIPSAASAVTLSQLRKQQEEADPTIEEEEEQIEPLADGSTTPVPEDRDSHDGGNGIFKPNAVQPSASASSSATSFASQLSPVPPDHYPASSPLVQAHGLGANMPIDQVYQFYPPFPSTSAPPPSILSTVDEAVPSNPSPSKSNNTSDDSKRNSANSSNNTASAHTSATTSTQPSLDIDRITPVLPAPNNSRSNTSIKAINSSSSNRMQPMRTNSSTSSGATSAMEAFRASNYDVSSLTESQIAKLKKKGIDPALYMEMRAATGGLGKDGKKRSKWARALVGNTFIG